jgi:hypothetical protein
MNTAVIGHFDASNRQHLLMQDAMLEELKQRMNQRGIYNKAGVPAVFRYVFKQHLRDILLDIYIWQPKKGWEWEQALTAMDLLIWTLTPPSTTRERQEIIKAIPLFIQSIKTLEKRVGIAQPRIDALLQEVELQHKRILRSSTEPKPEEIEEIIALPIEVEAKPPKTIRRPKTMGFANPLLKFRAQMPEMYDIEMREAAFEARLNNMAAAFC